MIPFDFDYYRPDTIEEAVTVYQQLDKENKNPLYFGGGSEIISMARLGNLTTGAVIDLKGIPECRVLEFESGELLLGSMLTLSDITESNLFPLMGKACGRIADHTMQCKITLGGNIASTIIYRETVLPLLLTDAQITVAAADGLRDYQLSNVFSQRLRLKKGGFIVKISVNRQWLSAPYIHLKKTKNEKIDYPLLSVACVKKDGLIRAAFSGLFHYPFRNTHLENILNDNGLSLMTRAEKAADEVSGLILNDLTASAEYRKFVFKNTIENILDSLKDVV